MLRDNAKYNKSKPQMDAGRGAAATGRDILQRKKRSESAKIDSEVQAHHIIIFSIK